MIGIDITASSTTEAPTIPVEAARRTPMITTVSASPPRSRPKTRTKLVISVSATPERSSICPMKMNIGRATSTQFCTCAQTRSAMIANLGQPSMRKVSTSNTLDRRMPAPANSNDSPPRIQAMGKPVNRRAMNRTR